MAKQRRHKASSKRSNSKPALTRKRRPPTHLKQPHLGEPASAGFVLICDIVAFSQMDQPKQADAICRLLGFLEKDELLKPRYDGEMNGTGDGALLAWSQRGKKTVSHRQIIEFGEQLIAHMRGSSKKIDLRVGIHVGQFRTVEPANRRLGIQLVGTGLNECARVSSLGDAGHIIISEAFVEHWRKAGDYPDHDFYPQGENPIVAFVKHDEPLGVRVLRRSDAHLPEKLRRLLCVDLLIRQTLEEIEQALVFALLDGEGQIGTDSFSVVSAKVNESAQQLSPRISIFSPARSGEGAQTLCPTEYRHHRDSHLRGKGSTQYAIHGENIEGPLARAFDEYEVQVVHRLPLFVDAEGANNDDYYSIMERHGIGKPKVKKMSRKARSFLAFPFGFRYPRDVLNSPHHRDPEGVVCLDMDSPLEQFEEAQLEMCLKKLSFFFNTTLSALWRLRTS